MGSYSCSTWDESGREFVYIFSRPFWNRTTVELSGMTADLDIFILQDSCDAQNCVAYGDISVTFDAEENVAYYIVVDGYAGAEGPYTLTVSCMGP